MISVKKIISIAAVAALSVSLFAQTSKTNTATAGIFTTDVDNYMDVNSWSEVKPEKLFAYFGMTGSNYDLGFAKNFKNCYYGTYFSGDFGNSTSTKSTTSTSTTEGGTSVINNTTSRTIFTFNNFVGLGNIGLGIGFDYDDHNNNSYNKASTGSSTKIDGTEWTVNVEAGLKEYKFNNYLLAPRANVYLHMNSTGTGTKTVTKATPEGEATTVDNRMKVFGLGVGSDLLLSKSETTEQTVSADLYFNSTSPVKTEENATSKTSSSNIGIPVYYKVVVNASDALAFGVKAGVRPTLGFGKTTTSIELAGTKTEIITNTFSLSLSPSLKAGVTYATKKYVTLNAGVGFGLPYYSYSSSKTKTTTDDNTTTTNTSTKTWNGGTPSLTYYSGFAINPTKNLCIDCYCDFVEDLFNNTASSLNENTDIWTTANKILVHNFTFTVTAKF